jgi:LPS-assembly protein
MISRNRFLITATWLCHLLLVPPLVTSQLPTENPPSVIRESAMSSKQTQESVASSADKKTRSQTPETPCARQAALQPDLPTICAIQQEKTGDVYKLHGAAEIYYRNYIIKADEMTYNSDTGEVTAQGHFALDGGPNDDHIRASHGTYNLETETGKFYDMTGTTGLQFHGTRVLLTSTAPFAFSGKTVVKDSPDHYLVYDGTITTCQLPHPKWMFKARTVKVDVGGNASIYYSQFLIRGIPIFYFPFATHPVEHQARQSGFLIPTVSRSSIKGNVVGDSAYWAMNRSMDLELGAEYFSLRGWSQRGEFRARPSDHSYADLNYFGVIDRGISAPASTSGTGSTSQTEQVPQKQGGEEVRLNAADNLKSFRAVADIDYLSSFVFRLVFNDIFTQAVYSEVKSRAFLTKSTSGFFMSGLLSRYQNFQSTTPGDVVTINHAPAFDLGSVDQKLGRSPLYWSMDTNVADLSRSGPGFPTVHPTARFDFNPEISVPLQWRGWSLRPGLTLHETYYEKRLINGGTPTETTESNPLNRQAVQTDVELRPPTLERVFDKPFLKRKWKHVIEPIVNYRYVTGVNGFANILRFDERDILTDTHEVEYGFVTRLFAKRQAAIEPCETRMGALIVGGAAPEQTTPWGVRPPGQPDCEPRPSTQEIVSWQIGQKYFLDPTFGGALVPGQRNVFASTIDLTGIAFATQPRHLSPLVSRLRLQTSERTDAEWDLDYDFQLSRINASTLLANYHLGPFTIGGGDAFLQIPLNQTTNTTAGAAPTSSTACSQGTLSSAGTCSFQQFRVGLGYGELTKRGLSAASSFGIDADTGILQFATLQTTYNWDCCGMTLEYRRFFIANVRNENLFRFTFTLANIGSFGTLRRQERLY